MSTLKSQGVTCRIDQVVWKLNQLGYPWSNSCHSDRMGKKQSPKHQSRKDHQTSDGVSIQCWLGAESLISTAWDILNEVVSMCWACVGKHDSSNSKPWTSSRKTLRCVKAHYLRQGNCTNKFSTPGVGGLNSQRLCTAQGLGSRIVRHLCLLLWRTVASFQSISLKRGIPGRS